MLPSITLTTFSENSERANTDTAARTSMTARLEARVILVQNSNHMQPKKESQLQEDHHPEQSREQAIALDHHT